MKATAPLYRTRTSARLYRNADLDRDPGAAETALNHDTGLAADQVITTARERLRSGAAGRVWWIRGGAR